MMNRNERIVLLRKFMSEKGFDYFIIYTADPHLSEYISECDKFREYFSGFTGSAGTMLVAAEKLYIWVDGRYYIQAETELKDLDIEILHIGEKGTFSLSDIINQNSKNRACVGLDGRYISKNDLQLLRKKIREDIIIDADAEIPEYVWPTRPQRKFEAADFYSEVEYGLSVVEKIKSVRKNIELKYKVNNYCYILSDLTSIMWLMNIRGRDIKYVPVAYSYLLIFDDSIKLFIKESSINDEQNKALSCFGIECIDYLLFYEYLKNIPDVYVLADKKNNNSFIFERLADKRIINVDDYLIVRKDIKNHAEISSMKKYHVEDAVAVIEFIYRIKKMAKENNLPNEYDAACMLDSFRLRNINCKGLSFETISAYGENASIVHYSAKENSCSYLKPRGFYLFDSGAHYQGCTTDITRTISLGELTEKEKRLYTAVLIGNIRLSNSVFMEGCRGENLDIVAREPLWRLGYDYRHGTGHGIGCELSVHEGPLAIRHKISGAFCQPDLQAGMIVSDEPGVYLRNEFGIRIENELLCYSKEKNEWGEFLGFEVLTLVPFEREAIIVDELTTSDREIINNYHSDIYEKLKDYFSGDVLEWLREQTLPI